MSRKAKPVERPGRKTTDLIFVSSAKKAGLPKDISSFVSRFFLFAHISESWRRRSVVVSVMKNMLLITMFPLLVAGCALTTEEMDLVYLPQPGVSAIPGAEGIIVSVKVNDQRMDKTKKVSSKKNGFGQEMAPILAREDVTVTLRQAMGKELKARGFPLGDPALVSVVADLTRFWNDHKTGFFAGGAVADLNLEVTVIDEKGVSLYRRHFAAQGIEPNTQLMIGNNARLALNRAMENGMRILFDDQAFISALLEVTQKSTT